MNTNDIHITLPASKSLSNRWLVLNYLSGKRFQLRNLSDSDDTQLLRHLLSQLERNQQKRAKGLAMDAEPEYYCANAGTVARFLMSLLCTVPGVHVLSGSDRLKRRPMAHLIEALNAMGFSVRSLEEEGCIPVRIEGGVPRRKMAIINPTQSSQFVSSLLLLGCVLPDGITVSMTARPASRPYIEMTCDVLRKIGVEVTRSSNGRIYQVAHNVDMPKIRAVSVESDWSAASYFYVVALMLPGVRFRLKGLSLKSAQGDVVVADIFSKLGVVSREVRSPYRSGSPSVTIQASGTAEKSLKYNFIDCPDLLPSVAVACAYLGVKANLLGVKNLRAKESDRLNALQTELNKMGGSVTATENELRIKPARLHPVQPVETYDDHRIAMAFAPLQIPFPDLQIVNPEIVSKSFPDFWNQLHQCKKVCEQ